ncbi:hypothetical protein DPEC_G00171670 [Dallia pectoralis]|uniref:Uncharacterized protein n=1 Tax=Dallia pectoralis TaxID=75939 RepID=A0ACC2GDN9_DALPE|nr:hypothetical protein DPEC_G00171670 [Dallia pectoralis]
MARPPPPLPRKLVTGKSLDAEAQRKWSYGSASPPDTPKEAKPPPPLPRKLVTGKSLDAEAQRKWSYGSASPPDTPKEAKVHGSAWNKSGEAQANPFVRRYSQAEDGDDCSSQADVGVADMIRKIEAGKNKKVMGSPLPKATFVFDKTDSSNPCKEVFFQENIMSDPYSLMEWWETVIDKSWDNLVNDPNQTQKGEAEQFSTKAQLVLNAVQLYNLLLNTHGEDLKEHVTELNAIADNLDKVGKGTKIAGITGGATGALGGAAAVAGVLFAPITMGASLALTVVGVGVAAAGGVTGASAAITNKVSGAHDRKKIERILEDTQDKMQDIEACLTFINVGMEQLRKHNLSTLNVVNTTATFRVAKVAEVTGVGSTSAIKASSKVSGNLQGFALGMDMYFSKKKDGKGEPKLKKGMGSNFARKIREMSQELDEGLQEMFKVKDDLMENSLII